MFYAADALLASRELSFSSHGAVHGAIGKEFAKTGDLDPKFHRWLLDAYDQRQAATYGISIAVFDAGSQFDQVGDGNQLELFDL